MRTADIDRLLSSVPTGLWIGGEQCAGSSSFDGSTPPTATCWPSGQCRRRRRHRRDGRRLCGSGWLGGHPARERGEILRSVFEMIIERADDIATPDDARDGQGRRGKPGEVRYGAEFFRWFAEEAVRIAGRFTPSPAGTGGSWSPSSPSDRAWPSHRGTFRWLWEPAR